MRPNIRVEIQNNLVEKMEVDENEEGEVSDSGDDTNKEAPQKQIINVEQDTVNKVPRSGFCTGLAVPDIKEQEKLLQERARRFRLNPSEIKNFTDSDLLVLYSSLGINTSNEDNVRFEVIHMRGIDQMNAADVLDYFMEYAPVSVEWVDEECCNVLWSDRMSTARALHFISKAVRGMPVRDDSCYFDSITEDIMDEEKEENVSILLNNKNRQVELKDDSIDPPNKLLDETNSVDISVITTTIPPGFWRLGAKNAKAKCLLLRFGLKTDKKSYKTEQFSRYYKLIQNKKNQSQQKTQGIFGRNRDMHRKTSTNENPWSVLAQNWDEDAPFREKSPVYKNKEEPTPRPEPRIAKAEAKGESLKVRLGKRKDTDSEKEEDEEDEREKPSKKAKVPRMRMYADEEEEKIKRRKMLKRINQQMRKIERNTSSNSDLRSVLNMQSRTHAVKMEPPPEPEVFDLGTRLKNRSRKMVFEIKRETSPVAVQRRDRSRERRRATPSDDEEEEEEEEEYVRGRGRHVYEKPRSKVAVVIKKQQQPSVASTVWSRVSAAKTYSESEESPSSSSSSSEEEEESADETVEYGRKSVRRPGFDFEPTEKSFKSPLKIEISNDHFRSRR